MTSHILHSQPVPTECAVVEVTMIREGSEFEDLDYPDEDEGIEILVDAKGTFILWPRKDIIVKTRLSPIVSPQSIEATRTPTSNMLKSTQNGHPSATPPPLKTVKTQSTRRAREKAAFSSKRVPRPRALGQHGA
jgi:hypothetical protein